MLPYAQQRIPVGLTAGIRDCGWEQAHMSCSLIPSLAGLDGGNVSKAYGELCAAPSVCLQDRATAGSL